jgi:CheY-like chemotaxis protein
MDCRVYLFSFALCTYSPPYNFAKNEISESIFVRYYDCFRWGNKVWWGHSLRTFLPFVNIIMPTLLLIEPHPALRQSLRDWLESNFSPCTIFEANNVSLALTLASAQMPRAIILDLDALSAEEQDEIQKLHQAHPKTPIIGIGLDDTPTHRQRAEAAGATAFIPKSQLQAELTRLIQTWNSKTEV